MKLRLLALILLVGVAANAENRAKPKNSDSLNNYLARVRSAPVATTIEGTPGSLWIDSGLLAESVSDPRARNIGDVVTIQIVELTTASSTASVDSQRQFSASSGVSALGGKIKTSGIDTLFSPSSAQTLKGQGATTADSKLQTTLSGRVVAVLPSGALVVEAERDVKINEQRNHVVVRGIARPSDISAANTVVSSKLSDLEVELAGKGVVSDGTRQPNFLVRFLLKLLNF